MKTLLTIGLILICKVTFGQYSVEKIYITLTDQDRNIITDISPSFKVVFKQEADTITAKSGKLIYVGESQICQNTDYRNTVTINNFVHLKYYQDNGQYQGGTWELTLEKSNDIPNDVLFGLYIIEITDTTTNRKMELLFRPQSIACQKVSISHRQGRYYICAPTYEEME